MTPLRLLLGLDLGAVAVVAALTGVGAVGGAVTLPVNARIWRECLFALAALWHSDSIGHTPHGVKAVKITLDIIHHTVYT